MPGNDFLSDDLAILAEFVDESESDLAKITALCLRLEQAPSDLDAVREIFRPIHSIKGNSAFLGLMNLRMLSHEIESVLDELRRQKLAPNAEIVTRLLAGIDELKAMLGRIRRSEEEVGDKAAFNALLQSLATLREAQPAAAPAPQSAPAQAAAPSAPAPAQAVPSPAPESSRTPRTQPAEPGARPAARPHLEHTVRVREALLDQLQSLCSRLEAATADLASGVASGAAPAKMEELGRISGQLSALVAEMRKVPMRELLQRAPRIARDIASATGKIVTVHVSGEDIAAPRRVVEALESPLTHLVRNAVDHGIETPVERRRRGKFQEGRLTVEASRQGDDIVLRVADDGAGIDFKALLRKAIELGLCPKNRSLTPDDVMNLIFLPGVSGAKTVTEYSGRGVGMDVVKSSVEAIGGKVTVSTKTNEGTEVRIVVPG